MNIELGMHVSDVNICICSLYIVIPCIELPKINVDVVRSKIFQICADGETIEHVATTSQARQVQGNHKKNKSEVSESRSIMVMFDCSQFAVD